MPVIKKVPVNIPVPVVDNKLYSKEELLGTLDCSTVGKKDVRIHLIQSVNWTPDELVNRSGVCDCGMCDKVLTTRSIS